MVEFAANIFRDNFIPLPQQEHKEAQKAAKEVWELSSRLIQESNPIRIPHDTNYSELILVGQGRLEPRVQREMDLMVRLVSSDCGNQEKDGPLPGETYYFLRINSGTVVRETISPNLKQERHEAGRKELEELFKTIKFSRTFEESMV